LGGYVSVYTNWKTAIGCGNVSPPVRVMVEEAHMILKRILAITLLGAAFAAASVPAHADSDDVHFFEDIRVAPNSPVFFGDVHISGKAHHDVVNFFGEVTADDNAQIGNDLVSFFGFVKLKKNVSVGRDMVSMLGAVDTDASVSIGHDHVEFPFWIALIPFLIIFGIVWLIVHQVRENRWRRYMAQHPAPPFPPGR